MAKRAKREVVLSGTDLVDAVSLWLERYRPDLGKFKAEVAVDVDRVNEKLTIVLTEIP